MANCHPVPVPGWPYVRTQVHPDARLRATLVAERLGWRIPRVYTAAAHYLLLRYSVDKIEAIIRRSVSPELVLPPRSES